MTRIILTRIGGSKVRTGCATCKSRHVKCDEAKPVCNRCVRAGRACAGYPSAANQTRQNVPLKFVHYAASASASALTSESSGSSSRSLASLSAWPDLKPEQVRMLDFYKHRTAPDLGGDFYADLWSRLILQQTHCEAPVLRAVTALGALHELYVNRRLEKANADEVDLALRLYGQSMREVMSMIQKDSRKNQSCALVCCALFASIEAIQGHPQSASSHIMSALSVLATGYRQGIQPADEILLLLQRFFIGAGVQIWALTDESQCAFTVLDSQILTRTPVPDKFTSLSEAMSALELLFVDIVRFSSLAEVALDAKSTTIDNLRDLARAKEEVETHYCAWTSSLDNMLKDPFAWKVDLEGSIIILRINQIIARVVLEVTLDPTELSFDDFLPEFKQINRLTRGFLRVGDAPRLPFGSHSPPSDFNGPTFQNSCNTSPSESSRAPVFTQNINVLPALFLVASRCRDPTTRRQAVELMEMSDRREGVWDSAMVASVARDVIKLEEEAAREHWQRKQSGPQSHNLPTNEDELGVAFHLTSATDVPLAARIKKLETFLGPEKSGHIVIEDRSGRVVQDRVVEW